MKNSRRNRERGAAGRRPAVSKYAAKQQVAEPCGAVFVDQAGVKRRCAMPLGHKRANAHFGLAL